MSILEEKKIIAGEHKAELKGEQPDNVVGGIFIQHGWKLTCSKCGKEFTSSRERENHDVTCRG